MWYLFHRPPRSFTCVQITTSPKDVNHKSGVNTKFRLINKTTVDRLCQDLIAEDWNDQNKLDTQDAYKCL